MCSIRPPPTALAVDEERDLAAGRRLGRVRGEDHLDRDVAGRKRPLRLLGVLEHAQHGVVVLQLSVLDVEPEAPEVVERRHDHAFDAALGDDQVGADRVRVVVDPRDHPARGRSRCGCGR